MFSTLALSSLSIAALVFAVWELLEYRFFRELNWATLHYLYITRGIASSLLLAGWAAWFVLRHRRSYEAELQSSRERYRRLLEISPGAIALIDQELMVREWNMAAERLYGFTKSAVLDHVLPTVSESSRLELCHAIGRLLAGESALDVESVRTDKAGNGIEVQLSLRKYSDPSGQTCFLEVTTDIRERVRLRQTLLEIEKLTTMGKMAAGTAHHLNTPLAAMLLRVEMMRDRPAATGDGDLKHLEDGLHFCQRFVQRLLEFSRRPVSDRKPLELSRILHSVSSFLAPSFGEKYARFQLQIDELDHEEVFADQSQIEALLLILLSNSLDAVSANGKVMMRCRKLDSSRVQIQIEDDGIGITSADLTHVFEPFFTTKVAGKGTGLGLAIAQNIASEHGGQLRLESEIGRGTTATIELPLTSRLRSRS